VKKSSIYQQVLTCLRILLPKKGVFMARVRKEEKRFGVKSCYQFKNFSYDADGKRLGAYPIFPLKRHQADLINTAYFNPSKKTKTVYCLMWDLDSDRASSDWKREDGSLDWPKMADHLIENHLQLMDQVTMALRSTSGKGIHLVVAITPLEIVDSTESCQRLAQVVQAQVFNLLSHYEMGVDRGALGLERDFVNWHNKENIIDGSIEALKVVQSDKNRPPVLSMLSTYLNTVPMCSNYKHKKGDESLLYPDIRSEAKFALLYYALHTQYFDEDRTTVELTVKEIHQLTGLSYPTIKKVLSNGLHWLETEYLGHFEGWALTIKLDKNLTERAYSLLEAEKTLPTLRNELNLTKPLEKPEEVTDGMRNEWITRVSLMLKHAGIEKSRALVILKHHVSRVDGAAWSRNCKNALRILDNIYFNKPELFNLRGGLNPTDIWLLEFKTKLQKGRSPFGRFWNSGSEVGGSYGLCG
jgi:hypothetical protein